MLPTTSGLILLSVWMDNMMMDIFVIAVMYIRACQCLNDNVNEHNKNNSDIKISLPDGVYDVCVKDTHW